MLKYLDKAIVLQEVPDEISLALEITNCPYNCKNCHSPHLRENIGIYLTTEEIESLIKENPDISCICLMGGDSERQDIIRIANIIHSHHLKIAFYSGSKDIDLNIVNYLDYYKVGPYIETLGPLNNKNTNQIMYLINNKLMKNITEKFWK